MPKVLISDKMSPRAGEIFRARGVEVDEKPGMAPEVLASCIGEYDGLAVRSATKVTAEIIEAAGNLRVIGRAGIGVDNIDIDAATTKGILVMNTPFGNSITTAEHAIALMMTLARQLPEADASTQAGKWEKSRFMGVEITGKTLGIIGCGNIGTIVADRARGLKMNVIAFDPYLAPARAAEMQVEKVELEELFRRADFISLHTPLTDSTRNIIDAAAIDQMKSSVRIINCARGGLVDEAALKAALDDGRVAGAAFDVFAEEPAKKNPLFGTPGFIATPHLGASTEEAQENVAVQVAEQIADYLISGAVTNPINMPAISSDEAPMLRPYLKLAHQLGSFAGQITETAIRSVRITYEGQAAGLNTEPMTAAVLTGLLTPQLEGVNAVNAPHVAAERGIEVEVRSTDQAADYQTRVIVAVETERRRRHVAGTLVGGDKPRLIQVEEIHMEAALEGTMLFVRSKDRPGMIGAFGNTLAEADVNIATFHLGRTAEGGDVITLISVDQPVNDLVLMNLCALPNVDQVKTLVF